MIRADQWNSVLVNSSPCLSPILTSFLQEEHSVQKNQRLHNWSQQQSQTKIYHYSALLLQQAFHTDRVKGQLSRQANTSEAQTGIPIKTKKALSSALSKDGKPRPNILWHAF